MYTELVRSDLTWPTPITCRVIYQTNNCRVVVFVDEDNGDVDNIPSDGEGLDGNDETSDESEADSDVSEARCKEYQRCPDIFVLPQYIARSL